MLCSNDDEWVDAISQLIENEGLRDKLWKAASLELLTNRSVERKISMWYWAYRKAVVQRFGKPTNGVKQNKLVVATR